MATTDETTPTPAPSSTIRNKRKAPVILAGLIGAAFLIGGGYVLVTYGHESTDDAQIEGHVLQVAARIPGQVLSVRVEENQRVKAGDVLIELDPSEYAARVDAAKGDQEAAAAAVLSATSNLELTQTNTAADLQVAQGGLVQAESGLTASHAALAQAQADRDAAQSRFHLAEVEYQRTLALRRDGAVAAAEFDARQAAFDQAKAQLAQTKAHLQSMQASIRGSGGTISTAQGKLAVAKAGPQQVALAEAALAQAKARKTQADAALKLAELNLSYTQLRAPFDGFVSKRSVEPGQLVGPDRALFAIVADHDLWVVANFKEDQIAKMRPGQPVTLTVDAFGHRHFNGEVESLSNATGARFTLLPPDNASGNFVKVTQRVPVRVRLLGEEKVDLRVGMSVDLTVDTNAAPNHLSSDAHSGAAKLADDEK